MADSYDSELARKLNVKSGKKLHVIGKPADVNLHGLPTSVSPTEDGVLIFVTSLAEVQARGEPLSAAAREDRLAWVAYPKAGRLGTDLNRDILWRHLSAEGIQGVRQVAIDDTWSAMRFRPGK